LQSKAIQKQVENETNEERFAIENVKTGRILSPKSETQCSQKPINSNLLSVRVIYKAQAQAKAQEKRTEMLIDLKC
jgi:hypothetical protein